MNKIKLETTLKLLQKCRPCMAGMVTLKASLPKDYPADKPINLLHILESNGLAHFFWAWRATIKKESFIKRLILADIVESSIDNFNKQFPNDSSLDNVVSLLRKVKISKKALKEAAFAIGCAADSASSAACVPYAIKSAQSVLDSAVKSTARSALYAAAYASKSALYAADSASYLVVAASYAAEAPYAAAAAYAAAYASESAEAATYAYYASAGSDIPRSVVQEKQITIINKYLK